MHFPLKFLNFLAPGSGSRFPIRLRIHKVTESGSNPNPDPQPWKKLTWENCCPYTQSGLAPPDSYPERLSGTCCNTSPVLRKLLESLFSETACARQLVG
jgi:hypothetical protein